MEMEHDSETQRENISKEEYFSKIFHVYISFFPCCE